MLMECDSIIGDIRDLAFVKQVFQEVQPEIVIHLAAQSLVRYSYQNPRRNIRHECDGNPACTGRNQKCKQCALGSDDYYRQML
jgi:GDP-D-mannose dehydratase